MFSLILTIVLLYCVSPLSSSPPLEDNSSIDLTSKHYTGSDHASAYEAAFFYSSGNDYTTYLQMLVQNKLGILTNNNAIMNDIEMVPDNLLATGQEKQQQQLQQRRRFLDIGGGEGVFTKMLIDNAPNIEALVIDPFIPLSFPSNVFSTSSENVEPDFQSIPIQFVRAGAEEFLQESCSKEAEDVEYDGKSNGKNRTCSISSTITSSNPDLWWKNNYHQVLMKEVIHHFNAVERMEILRGIRLGFSSHMTDKYDDYEVNAVSGSMATPQQPSLLIITRPQLDIDYPLWPEARNVWSSNQPSLDDITTDLSLAGYQNIQHSVEAYPCYIPLQTWFSMIKSRFWSTFAHFSDDELAAACQWIENFAVVTDDEGKIRFEDRLLFITADK